MVSQYVDNITSTVSNMETYHIVGTAEENRYAVITICTDRHCNF